jgi:hypothetical protein
MAVGLPMKTTYADGDVYSSQDVNDITGTINLFTSSTLSMAGGKNLLVNGGADIWQRGTTFTNPGVSSYLFDRWLNQNSGASVTVSQQTTGTPNGSRYIVRVASTGASQYLNLAQLMETNMVAPLWGKASVFSVKLRRNAGMASAIDLYIQKSATVDAGTGATWTTISTTSIANASLPTGTTSADWFSATLTASIPNDGTANSLRVLVATTTANMASGHYWEMAQAQLELGSTATTFSRAGGTIQGELAACQRYYWRAGGNDVYERFANGLQLSTTSSALTIQNPVVMRISPTSIDYSTLLIATGNNQGTVSNLVIGRNGNYAVGLTATHGSFGATNTAVFLSANNSTSAYVGLSAEL